MPCYTPLTGTVVGVRADNGKQVIKILPRAKSIPANLPGEYLSLPCGQCTGCRIARSKEWAIRCWHESKQYEKNCFITLTFCTGPSESHQNCNHQISKNLSTLVKSDFQNFMKRLRKEYYGNQKSEVRYFHCGEYGSKLQRPHHHACLFNFDFPDKKLWSVRDGITLYRSESLERIWPFGYSTIGEVTFESAAYVARYVLKKINGPLAPDHYQGRLPEYVTMSRRPGIGRSHVMEFLGDIYPHDYVVLKNGTKARPPKYYDRYFELTDPEEYGRIKKYRVDRAKSDKNNTPERLKIRHEIQKLKAKQLIRSYEQ